ncbi:GAF domain-containing protein [Nocardioides massiliensis]|uniref:GAF domain-containing protein n=1 Tax=Nocardioides massiliensis TaxID=1325935 RepID=A0ABT9NRB0_9ACTN|nr:GAF domain-containing protein [Nocardioides massiliensis]MDP9822928.1 hypothetical protein [Nocardioides massiliensis]
MSAPSPSPVFRAPMRSRDDTVDHAAALAWAFEHDLCGVGERGDGGDTTDARVQARAERFAAAPAGAFVWTQDAAGVYRLGRITGEATYDESPVARRHDLPHQRPCAWLPGPVPEPELPAAVRQTFARGGRNFQRINPATTPGDVEAETAVLWERYAD